MSRILLHTGERRFRVEEPLTRAGYTVLGIPENIYIPKFLKLFHLIKLMVREHPDLILIDSAGLMCLSAYVLSVLFRVPLIIRARADIWRIYEEQSEYKGIIRRMYEYLLLSACTVVYRRVAHIFSVSHSLKHVIHKKGVDSDNISVIRFSIDLDRFKPTIHEKHPVHLLSVVNFTFKTKTQGILDILPAIDELISTYDIEYVIAGRGRFAPLVEEAISHLNNPDNIHYVGFQPHIEDLYAQSSIYIQYSYLDAYPAAVLEAMASGLPVIALNRGGMVEQIREGGTGLLVDDLAAFRNAVKRLVEDTPFREEMGRKGRAYVENSFTTSALSRRYKEVIERVLKKCT